VSLIYLSCAWVVGIFLGARVDFPLALIAIGLIPLPLLFLFRQHKKLIILTGMCLLALFAGAFHFQSSLPPTDERSLQFYNDQPITFKGIINTDPEISDKTIHLQVSATDIQLDTGWQEVSGTVLIFAPRYSTYNYGDVLLVTGKLETPYQFDDFDYRAYLAHHEIYSTMLYPEIDIVERDKGAKLLTWIYSIRNGLSQTMAEVLPEPQASLAQGIILGKKGTIPTALKDAFTSTGTAHLLAISGLHLSIVAGILLSVGIWLFGRRRYIYIWLALGAIWLYALLTGMHPPIIRGTIMASLFLIAELLGRQKSAVTALLFAAAVMVGVSPQILWTASFQLSFLAMAGLIFITPPLQAIGRTAVNRTIGEDGIAVSIANVIGDSFAVTLGAMLAVWPVVAYYFGIISFVGPLATLLALPALPGIIITGALTGGLGLIALPLAYPIGWLAWLFLSYLLLVVNVFAALPISSSEVGSVDTTLMGGYYLALVVAIWFNSNRNKLANIMPKTTGWLKSRATGSLNISRLPVKWIIPPLLIIAILVSVAAATMPDDNLHVSFLDVGEGDAIFIQTPAHQDILVDGGPSPQAIGLELGKKMPFWDRTIDLVILTHPHADHLTGLVEVLQRYNVRQVLYTDLDCHSPLYDEWLSVIKEKAIKYTTAQAGQQVDCGEGVVMNVLNPPSPHLTDTQSDIDNNGVVLRLSMGDASFLLTADIFWEAEFELITNRANLESTVLKVAHHGSDTSTTQEFLAVANPQIAVISAGVDNPHGHPSPEVMERLTEILDEDKIYLTSESGTIEFTTDGERLWVEVDK